MTQHVKMQLAMLTTGTRVPVLDSAVLILIQLPTTVPGKTVKNDSSSWALAPHVEHQDGVPGLWLLQPDALLDVAVRK